jgi:hypothetical protein
MKFNFSILFILWSLKSLLHGPEVQSAPAEESSLLLVHVVSDHFSGQQSLDILS